MLEFFRQFDDLIRLYERIEQLLTSYRSGLEQGQLAGDVLEEVRRCAEQSADLLSALSTARSVSTDGKSPPVQKLQAKKQQALQVLGRVLQCLTEVEQSTRQLCAGLAAQTQALCQIRILHGAYELALATCQTQTLSNTEEPLPDTAHDARLQTSDSTD